MESPQYPHTFIVRVTRDGAGSLSGVVERVRSGEKQRFDTVAGLAQVITAMVERERRAKPKEHTR